MSFCNVSSSFVTLVSHLSTSPRDPCFRFLVFLIFFESVLVFKIQPCTAQIGTCSNAPCSRSRIEDEVFYYALKFNLGDGHHNILWSSRCLNQICEQDGQRVASQGTPVRLIPTEILKTSIRRCFCRPSIPS